MKQELGQIQTSSLHSKGDAFQETQRQLLLQAKPLVLLPMPTELADGLRLEGVSLTEIRPRNLVPPFQTSHQGEV